jgi:hypothetical protein
MEYGLAYSNWEFLCKKVFLVIVLRTKAAKNKVIKEHIIL